MNLSIHQEAVVIYVSSTVYAPASSRRACKAKFMNKGTGPVKGPDAGFGTLPVRVSRTDRRLSQNLHVAV